LKAKEKEVVLVLEREPGRELKGYSKSLYLNEIFKNFRRLLKISGNYENCYKN